MAPRTTKKIVNFRSQLEPLHAGADMGGAHTPVKFAKKQEREKERKGKEKRGRKEEEREERKKGKKRGKLEYPHRLRKGAWGLSP